MEPSIKIYGERNTGTHFLQCLVSLNFRANILPGVVPLKLENLFKGNELVKDIYFKITFSKNLGWKHSIIYVNKLIKTKVCLEKVLFLTLTKNPYSWLISLYNRPYHAFNKYYSFEDFLKSPWRTVGRENYKKEFLNPMDMWNKKNYAYLKMAETLPTLNIKYEDLLANPDAILSKISNDYGIKMKTEKIKIYEQSCKDEKGKTFSFYRNYYLKEKWRGKLHNKEIDIINKYLNTDLMYHFGYEKQVP